MDQNNSANGSAKRNWREKLGIPNKEAPKLADEYSAERAEPQIAVGGGRPGPALPRPHPAAARAPQPVTRPAPMAPRSGPAAPAPAPKAAAPAGAPRPQQQQARAAGAPQKANGGGPSLAERLKAQRVAAEQLAEQRVAVSKEKIGNPPALAAGGAKPKFTFADEELAAAKREPPREAAPQPAPPPPRTAAAAMAPPLVPPRPALGGDRPLAMPSLGDIRKPMPSYQPQFTAPPQPAFRPIEPPAFQPRPVPAAPPRAYVPQPTAPVYREREPQPAPDPRQAAYESYRRAPPREEPPPPGEDDIREARRPEPVARREGREGPRLESAVPRRRQARPAQPPQEYNDDIDEIFEGERPARRRASPKEYAEAYREYEDGYGEERGGRSMAPWILLGALVVLGIIAAAAVWYYNTQMKPMAGKAGSDSVPVIAQPDQPSKVQPKVDNAGLTGNGEQGQSAPDTHKKQIYDRILGDQAIQNDQMAPAGEVPVQPPAAQGGAPVTGVAPQPAAPGVAPAPSAAAPDSAEPVPLPLPLPPDNNTQGAITPDKAQQTVAALTAPDKQTISPAGAVPALPPPIPEPPQIAMQKSDPAPSAGPDPGADQEQGDTGGAADESQATPPSVEKPAAKAIEPGEAKPKKKVKTAVAVEKPKKKITSAPKQVASNAEPVVLVPPVEQPIIEPLPATEDKPAESKSFFSTDRQRGGGRPSDGTPENVARKNFNQAGGLVQPGAGEQPPEAQQQIASVEPSEPAVPPKNSGSQGASGYSVQLASFASKAEALAEMDRLRARHPDVLGGLSTRVSEGSVSGSTRYRLRAGDFSSRDQARNVCNSLISSGERDCAVVGP